MAYNPIPVNANNRVSVAYDSPLIQTHNFDTAIVGNPAVAASGASTGNGDYVLCYFPVAAYVFETDFTVTTSGTGTGSLTLKLLQGNNGVNVSNTITFQNVLSFGTNAAGNTASIEFNYNVLANGVNSSSNVVASGGFFVNGGSVLIATSTGNTLVVAGSTEWAPAALTATFHK